MATNDVVIDMSNAPTPQYINPHYNTLPLANTPSYNIQQNNINIDNNRLVDRLVDIDTTPSLLISVCKFLKKYFPNSIKNYDDLSA